MDPDSPWDENTRENHIPEAEWTRISSEFTNSGYREGIIAGKEAFLQAGFDEGFATVGVPLGRELGILRGVAAAIKSLLNPQDPHSPDLEELRSISSALSAISFSDVAPIDVEAEQHAREHFDFNDPAIVHDTVSVEESAPQESRSTADVAKLRERLVILSRKLGLPLLI